MAQGHPLTQAPNCPDCGGTLVEALGRLPDVAFFAGRALDHALPGGELQHCKRCDLRFRWPQLPNYAALYEAATVDAWSVGPLRKDQRLVNERVCAQAHAKNVLDFGCFAGGFLARLPEHLAKFGVEVATDAAAMASSYGVHVVSTLDKLPSELKFDVIVAMDVIEHVNSPRTLVAQWLSRLQPGGALLITTGDGDNALWRMLGPRWWYCYYPEHIAFISAPWLQFHSQALGARVRSVDRFNYLDAPMAGGSERWTDLLKYLLRPAHHARKREQHLARHGLDRGVPGIGLTRDHLLIELTH